MKPLQFMLIAGEASGDMLAAELVRALKPAIIESQSRLTSDLQPLMTTLEAQLFGAGGPKMAEAGVEVVIDLTAHAVFGLTEVLKQYPKFKRFFRQLFQLAIERAPDVIILVDYAGFNRRFAAAIKRYVRSRQRTFNNWNPKIVYYVSPQVWASREYRTYQLARDVDLLLSIFPFEKDWYARRVPQLRVEFVGHPMVDRYRRAEGKRQKAESGTPQILLLPGSRVAELRWHLPLILPAAKRTAQARAVRFRLVLPDESLLPELEWSLCSQLGLKPRRPADSFPTIDGVNQLATRFLPALSIQIGGLAESLANAAVAVASSGTVTLECAFFGVPTLVIYKTAWPTYWIARRLVRVKAIAMPNLLAGEPVFPELLQDDATPENIARETLDLLTHSSRRDVIGQKLAKVSESLGPPGATGRAAKAIVDLLYDHSSRERRRELAAVQPAGV